MEEAKKNMYAFSTTTYTGFQCTVDEETSEKFKGIYQCQALTHVSTTWISMLALLYYIFDFIIVGLPGVLWVLPDSYIDVKNKDYGGDLYA